MTNREYLINQLSDPDTIDDGGASYESTVYYDIACPYLYGDTRAFCFKKTEATREMCFECKEKWLDNEVDE